MNAARKGICLSIVFTTALLGVAHAATVEFLNDGTGRLQLLEELSGRKRCDAAMLADLDLDGGLDLILGSSAEPPSLWLMR